MGSRARTKITRSLLATCCCLALAACAEDDGQPISPADAGAVDAGAARDAEPADSGDAAQGTDAASAADASRPTDALPRDAAGSATDSGPEDAGQPDAGPPPPPLGQEPWRPQYHYTPAAGWMNDPNGLVYLDGEYHLFYQHFPDSVSWGPMHWGHAVSPDLVHWQELGVALEPDRELGWAFSGSAVVAHGAARDAVCGDGLNEGVACLVAIFTHHGGRTGGEKQSLACSVDRGRSWTLYAGNPVLESEEHADFRDPKVFWHEDTQRWVMVLAVHDHVELYAAPDLVEWTFLSAFGPVPGADDGEWECPDLFALPVEGEDGVTRWVLQLDLNYGLLDARPGSRYLIGDFDGTRFVPEHEAAQTLDAAPDFYAAQSWSAAPNGRRIWLAWMSSWGYALLTPTTPWRGVMSVPRELSLARFGGDVRLRQQPVAELELLRHGPAFAIQDEAVDGTLSVATGEDAGAVDLSVILEPGEASEFGLRLRGAGGEEAIVGYAVESGTLYADRRSCCDDAELGEGFAARHEAAVALDESGALRLRVLVDWSSVEVFAQGGVAVLSESLLPDSGRFQAVELFSAGGAATVVVLEAHTLASRWDGDGQEGP